MTHNLRTRLVATCTAALLVVTSACQVAKDYGRPLPEGAPALLPLDPGEAPPRFGHDVYAKAELLPALEQSITWTKKKSSAKFFPIEGVTQERATKSLERFKQLLTECTTPDEFESRVLAEFEVLKSAGWDGRGGGVLYTAYCTPILPGSRTQTAQWRYPLYAMPNDLAKGEDGVILGRQTTTGYEQYPDRATIEASALLVGKGLELAWLQDPIDAYIAHVNGSAFIRLEDSSLYKLGYSAKNGREYSSLGQALVADGQLSKDGVSLRAIRAWAQANPDKVQDYLHRNESYVFFTPIEGTPRGSLNVPVTGNRSLATDKTLFPRGALVYVTGTVGAGGEGAVIDHFMLDQDTGGAIRTAGRADVYLGSGDEAEQVAGATRSEGQLYYFFVKE